MKKTLFILTILALGFTACNKEIDQPIESSEEVKPEVETPTTVYYVNIPASIGADTKAVDFSGTDPVTGKPTAVSSFTTSDKIYVFNTSSSPYGVWLDTDNGGYLSPSANGTSCELTGTLSGTINEGDVLMLMCNLNGYNSGYPEDKEHWHYDYNDQNGTQAGVVDGAIAKLKVKSIDGEGRITFCQEDDTDDPTALFDNVQAMFRFQFKDGLDAPVSVKKLVITSKKDMLVKAYYPHMNLYKYQYININLATATSDPIYAALSVDEKRSDGDVLSFWATSDDDKIYMGTRNGPTGENRFKNGKYYYNSSRIATDLLGDVLSVKWTDSGVALSPNEEGLYDIITSSADITTSGVDVANDFYLQDGGTVRLNGTTAYYFKEDCLIYSDGPLTLVVNGSNAIECKKYTETITANGPLKFSGNGTLTVTSNSDDLCGINADNYQSGTNDYETTTAIDLSATLAADGYTVTRSARTDNPDGTYTWTYTVAPIPNSYNDPEGNEIMDPGVETWLRDNHFTQADINALGTDAAATDKLYECWLYNCDFTVAGAGFVSLSVINTTSVGDDVKTATVQLIRKAPLGAINGFLYFYADGSTSPIPDESVEFFGDNNDPWFAIAPSTGEVTQTATATFNDSVMATTISAEISVFISYEPEPEGDI